ncbi:hypothetical protein [Nostoc sp. CHAB 5715]|uniref:hypothetical protein n=1 Tax=Nostoc sp. CHAB 5715 TaxID=2780400 RepID=UPI001E2CDDC8|nr:hypothetical protein [Nostoc sp. CHAB 5715]MCC5623454.1 hypothetical protein [Nostoc sp. CHAB 5715]
MQFKQFEPINAEKHEHEIVSVDGHEVESLDIQALDVQELERRLELAAAPTAAPTDAPTDDSLVAVIWE